MGENKTDELTALIELSDELNTDDIIHLRNLIGLPQGLCDDASNGPQFLSSIKRWNGHNSFVFYQSLQGIRPDLVAIACEIKWLCVSSPGELELEKKELSIRTLIDLLSTEIPKDKWVLIYMVVANEAGENVGFEITLNKMIENGFIKKDLKLLTQILVKIKRDDLRNKLKQYQYIFWRMEEGEFIRKFKNELGNQIKEKKEWELELKEFAKSQYQMVNELIGKDQSVYLRQVFVRLTIIKEEPRAVNWEDETTYSEIAYLRKIANKEVRIKKVNFKRELIRYKPTKPEIWCLIGNPGCGKTFLAKRTALRFSSSALMEIQYTISIPCRNTDWHSMESTRYEEEKKVESEFIQQWLCLGLPVGPSWTIDLAKHLNESGGEGLLLIIDGLDEFTRKVPFGKTFLSLLLTRQSLTKSTIILTSRPGAWTDISSVHEMKIDRNYQVLGFSPENRDLYFKKQITNKYKLKDCWNLMDRHDEMKQLSLIPVNASLFAALLKGENSTSINTLTNLYYELTLYMIRRELSRMGLQEFSRVSLISYLHTDIQKCLKRIGFIAFLGVANRDLASEENVPLIMGQEEYPNNCLGLAHEHYRKEAVGLIKKVWTFAHLTMQEFAAAHWLSNNTWTEQCHSIRYISISNDNFSLFKMLVRFLCGILSDKSAAILSIIYRYIIPQPIQLADMPVTYQMGLKQLKNFTDCSGLDDLTQMYFFITSLLFETNSKSIPLWFEIFCQFLPLPLNLFITETVSPNEWFCFSQSLKFVSQIQLVHIYTDYINPNQFKCLLMEMRNCFLKYLAIISEDKNSTTVLEYTDIIRDTEFSFNTRICINLYYCDVTDSKVAKIFSPTNQNLDCISLSGARLSNEFLKELANKLTALDCIVLPNKYNEEYYSKNSLSPINYEILLPNLCQATQLRVLHLNEFPEKYDLYLRAMLPNFSNLKEIQLDDYSQLTALPNLSSLLYLQIGIEMTVMKNTKSNSLYTNLLQLIIDNRHTLRAVKLYELNYSKLRNLSIFLNVLSLCSKIVQLDITKISLPDDDNSQWKLLGSDLKYLISLYLSSVTLLDTGFKSLCTGLSYHPVIKELMVRHGMLTSLSCDTLINLIPTITQLEKLIVSDLNEPDEKAFELFEQTTTEYSIKFELN